MNSLKNKYSKMQTFIFILILIPSIVQPYSKPCSSCPTFGCCNVWYQCASQLSDCAYYVGSTKAESEIGAPCLASTDCVTNCCSDYICAIESTCPNDPSSAKNDTPAIATCDACELGCCDSYRMCATDISSCTYYVGDVGTYEVTGDVQETCYDYQCSTGCCIGNLCAELEDDCYLPNWKIFMIGLLVFITLLFILIACTVRYLYNDKKNALYQEARKMIINKQIVGPRGRDPIENLVQNPNKILYPSSNEKVKGTNVYDI